MLQHLPPRLPEVVFSKHAITLFHSCIWSHINVITLMAVLCFSPDWNVSTTPEVISIKFCMFPWGWILMTLVIPFNSPPSFYSLLRLLDHRCPPHTPPHSMSLRGEAFFVECLRTTTNKSHWLDLYYRYRSILASVENQIFKGRLWEKYFQCEGDVISPTLPSDLQIFLNYLLKLCTNQNHGDFVL